MHPAQTSHSPVVLHICIDIFQEQLTLKKLLVWLTWSSCTLLSLWPFLAAVCLFRVTRKAGNPVPLEHCSNIRERKKGRGKTLPKKRSRQIWPKEQSCQSVQVHMINPSKSSDSWMIINTHKLCQKGTLHWCFIYHFCFNDRVVAYHEKCSLEFKIPLNHFESVKYLNAVLSPYLAHFLWLTLCSVALTNRRARQRVLPLH